MRKLIEMPYNNSGSVLIAVDIPKEAQDDEIHKVGVRDYLKPKHVEQNFNIITDMIINYSVPIIKSFEALSCEDLPASKASAEFGLSFNSKGNIYLVETALGATIKISIEWDLKKQMEKG